MERGGLGYIPLTEQSWMHMNWLLFELVMKVCILWVTTYYYLIMKLGDAIEHKLAADAQ